MAFGVAHGCSKPKPQARPLQFQPLSPHRPMGGYQLPEWIRITVGTPQENERCLSALKIVLNKKRSE
jgi:hypothetical protein